MKKKILIFSILILFASSLTSCKFSISKYEGTYKLYTWREYDATYYFGKDKKEINETYGSFSGQVIIDKTGKATFVYDEIYHIEDKIGKVSTSSKYLRFIDCPIPYDFKFELKEDYYIDGDYVDCLCYYSSKLTDGFIINRTEHKINCVLMKIEDK